MPRHPALPHKTLVYYVCSRRDLIFVLKKHPREGVVSKPESLAWSYVSGPNIIHITAPFHSEAVRAKLDTYRATALSLSLTAQGLAALEKYQYKTRNSDGYLLRAGDWGEYDLPDAPRSRCRVVKFHTYWALLETPTGDRVWGYTDDFYPLG